MLNTDHFSEELLNAYGWEKMDSKNPAMDSYINDEKIRLNHYFTTGTVTLQSFNMNIKVFKGINDDNKLEEILCKIK